MGKVTVFCPISGCTPELLDRLEDYFDIQEIDESEAGPLVTDAIKAITREVEERKVQQDVTAIGVIEENSHPLFNDGVEKAYALSLPDSSIRVIPHCTMGEYWDFGSISPPDPNPENIIYLVSFGTIIMVQAASLAILSLATAGRVSPKRLWRLLMHQGFSEGQNRYGLSDLDYYPGISDPRDQFPSPIPGISVEEVIALELLGDIELIKDAIIHKGQFWVWMRPNCFPLHPKVGDVAIPPIHIDGPSAANALCIVEKLPLEIMAEIMSHLSLATLLSLLSTSRHLRSKHLGLVSERDALARAWIKRTAPWYQMPSDVTSNGETHSLVGWDYLRRCSHSGSMRNRRRIWHNAEQIEKLCDQAGI